MMEDFLVILDGPSSKKNQFLLLKTFYASIRVNKTGKYIGSNISPADALCCAPVRNCDNTDIKAAFSQGCFQVGKNSYYISSDNLFSLFQKFGSHGLFFLDNTDKALYQIHTLSSVPSLRKPKYRYAAGNLRLTYYNDCSLALEKNEEKHIALKMLQPLPVLCFSQESGVYSLFFDYGGVKSAYMEKTFALSNGTDLYLKHFIYENTICDILLTRCFTKLSLNRFIYSGVLNSADLKRVLSLDGIAMDCGNDYLYPKIDLRQYDSDWFSIGFTCEVDGEMIDLASQMQLLAKKNTVTCHGKTIAVPESMSGVLDKIVMDDGQLRVNRAQIFNLLPALYASRSNISDLFTDSDAKLQLPEEMYHRAYPYQIEGIHWLKGLFLHRLGACLADDMGLGKTFQTIAFLSDRQVKSCVQKILVIAPKSLLTNWEREFKKFSAPYRAGIYHGDSRNQFSFSDCDVIISTYQTVCLDMKKLCRIKWSIIVFDEIQTIKNYKSITSMALKKLSADMRIGLSGTPMENSLSELWNIMDILNPKLFFPYAVFMRRYKNRNHDELKNILAPFIMRRVKQDVLKQLPSKFEEVVYCDMAPAQRKLYESIRYAVKTEIMRMKIFSGSVVLKGLLLLRECCCHPQLLDEHTNINHVSDSCKMETLHLLVDNLVESGHKVLIFSQFTKMLELIRQELNQYQNIQFYLDGSTVKRDQVLRDFEAAEKGIFLISIKAGGVGLNLVSAQDVIIFDPWWNPFVEQQAIDRVYRIGQDKPVHVFKLVAANTLEEKILDLQRGKEELFDEIINGAAEKQNVNLQDIINLL